MSKSKVRPHRCGEKHGPSTTNLLEYHDRGCGSIMVPASAIDRVFNRPADLKRDALICPRCDRPSSAQGDPT